MTTPTTKTPTAEAIETAIRNAAKMMDYSIRQSRSAETLWFVIKSDGVTSYTVDTLRGTCDCPYFVREGICKHKVAVDAEIALLEAEQAHEDFRDMIASRDE